MTFKIYCYPVVWPSLRPTRGRWGRAKFYVVLRLREFKTGKFYVKRLGEIEILRDSTGKEEVRNRVFDST